MPASIADSIGQRGADRPAGNIDIRAAIDQRSGHVDVIAAGRQVQRGLVAPGGVAEIRVCPGLDQQVHDLRAVGEITRPVGDQVQQGLEAAFSVHQPGPDQLGVLRQELPDHIDIAVVDSEHKLNGPRVIRQDLNASRLIAHDTIIAADPRMMMT